MPRSPVVIWVDGCYDGFHYGHTNLIRQARAMISADYGPIHVIAGVHSDAEIKINKGPTLFNEKERYDLVAGCRFIDQVVVDVPYGVRSNFFEKYQVDFVVHGDDPVADINGRDLYAEVKANGMYKECPRTDGISTTSLIQRVLEPTVPKVDEARLRGLLRSFADSIYPSPAIMDLAIPGSYDVHNSEDTTVVYVGGSWDCFGAAHVEYLWKSRESASLLGKNISILVGIWGDKTVEEVTGKKPLLVSLERALAVIQCRFTDALVLDAPKTMTSSLCVSLGISAIINGAPGEPQSGVKNIQVPIPPLQTLSNVQEKVLAYRSAYEERQERKGMAAFR